VNFGPRNRRTRAQRIEQWNASVAQGRRFQPRKVDSKHARYEWLRSVMDSDLPSTTRLVSHTLVSHGRADGSGIFPSVRVVAKKSGLSERAVCDHLDLLVRRGYLWRKARGGDTAGAVGFEYVLAVPTVLNAAQHSGAGVVLTDVQHGGRDGAERGSAR
jgi:hypothetical protein